MKDFCENQLCENPAFKQVRVSVRRPSDQARTLCASCEEVYSWGVQHGTITAQAKPALPHLDRLLKKGGFVVVTRNDGDTSEGGPIEAWAYQGPLNFQAAAPITFGVGASVPDALEALNLQLGNSRQGQNQAPSDDQQRGPRQS